MSIEFLRYFVYSISGTIDPGFFTCIDVFFFNGVFSPSFRPYEFPATFLIIYGATVLPEDSELKGPRRLRVYLPPTFRQRLFSPK